MHEAEIEAFIARLPRRMQQKRKKRNGSMFIDATFINGQLRPDHLKNGAAKHMEFLRQTGKVQEFETRDGKKVLRSVS